ncbi:hypothetical protein [Mixta tenebrionis]|nr:MULTISPECIES: hypothetical protein [Mixta]
MKLLQPTAIAVGPSLPIMNMDDDGSGISGQAKLALLIIQRYRR